MYAHLEENPPTMNEDIRRADDQESEHDAGEEVQDNHNYVFVTVAQNTSVFICTPAPATLTVTDPGVGRIGLFANP